jgi:nucleotide-binding universal stress UspA family protein
MKNILIAIDFSSISSKLIEVAAPIAEKFDAKIWLIHIAAPDPEFVGYNIGPQYIRDSKAEVLRMEHRELQLMAKNLRDKNLDTDALLIQGPTVETLVEEAAKLRADLVILGAEDHGKIFKAIFGSVWEEVLRIIKVPVLLVPA